MLSSFSFKKCTFFIFIYVVTITLILGSTTLIIIFIIKPHQPNFSLRTINLECYKIEVTGLNLLASSVVSLDLIAENPNRFGVRIDPTKLHVFYRGVVVGMVLVPGFYQPPHDKGLRIDTKALFNCVNVSEILSRVLPRESRNRLNDDPFRASILGDVVARVRLLRVNLPKIKFALECNISIEHSYFMLTVESLYNAKAAKNHTISLPINSRSFSKECSVAIYI